MANLAAGYTPGGELLWKIRRWNQRHGVSQRAPNDYCWRGKLWRMGETGSRTHEEESLGQWPQTSDGLLLVDFSL